MKRLGMALILALALGLALIPAPAQAAEDSHNEMGITFYANQDFDIDEGELKSAGIMVAWATTISQDASLRVDFRLEGLVGSFWDYGTGVEVAILPGLRLFFGSSSVKPYFEFGIGPSYNTLDIQQLGIGFNFLSYGGVGLRIEMDKDVSLDIGYRLRHISNAGLDERNHGVTSNQIQIGINWAF